MDIGNLVSNQVKLAQLGSINQTTTSAAIQQLFSASNLMPARQVSQTGSVTSMSQILAPANQRLTQQLDAANVKLSAYGQVKSAFASANTAALGLSKAATGTATAEVVKAAQAFVNTFNQATQTLSSAVNGTGTAPGALTTDLRAKFAGNDLAQSINNATGLANLRQAGISQDKNGLLTLNTAALTQSLQSTSIQVKSALLSLGQQVSTSTGRELSSSGNVGASVNQLTNQTQTLTSQQKILQQQATATQAILDQQSSVISNTLANGIAAYQSLMF